MEIDARTLLKRLKIDRQINSTKSFLILLNYRCLHYCFVKNNKILKVGGYCYKIIMNIILWLLRCNAQISYKAVLGERIKLPHSADGVIISSKAVIGNNVTIFHQCTLGINEFKPLDEQGIYVGNNCIVSAGCKIISCKIGDNCRLGPNTVCVKDIPENTLCYTKNETIIGYYQ